MRLDFDPKAYTIRGKQNGRGTTRYRPIPDGVYVIECIEVKVVVSKNGDKMLRAKFKLIDSPCDDAAYVWDYFLLECAASIDALEIARERLARWAEAAGAPDIKDTDELEHTRCRVKLAIEPGKGDYGPSNKIKYFISDDRKKPEVQPEPEPLADDAPW